MVWGVRDELELQNWVKEKGFSIVYLPEVMEFGFVHKDKPTEINGGFKSIEDLKQYLVNMKGDNKSVKIVNPGEFRFEMEKIAMANKKKRIN